MRPMSIAVVVVAITYIVDPPRRSASKLAVRYTNARIDDVGGHATAISSGTVGIVQGQIPLIDPIDPPRHGLVGRHLGVLLDVTDLRPLRKLKGIGLGEPRGESLESPAVGLALALALAAAGAPHEGVGHGLDVLFVDRVFEDHNVLVGDASARGPAELAVAVAAAVAVSVGLEVVEDASAVLFVVFVVIRLALKATNGTSTSTGVLTIVRLCLLRCLLCLVLVVVVGGVDTTCQHNRSGDDRMHGDVEESHF